MRENNFQESKIAVVIPYYNASKHICSVVSKLPSFVHSVIIVDDLSPQKLDQSAITLANLKGISLVFLDNNINLGVGGATKKGFQYAIENDFDYVIKMDADDQMDAAYLPQMLIPLAANEAEMCKGNRFRDLNALKKMPAVRRFGNLSLSFLTKMATGYWNNFDPNNGFLAIKVSTLRQIELHKLADRYFFESSLMAQLYFVKARIKDVAMPAIYGEEQSSMAVWRMPAEFSIRLLKVFVKRILKQYFLYDFNIGSLFLLTGLPLFTFGVVYGLAKWIHYNSQNLLAPTGTIMLVTLSIILGFQLLLQAIQYDIFNSPKAE